MKKVWDSIRLAFARSFNLLLDGNKEWNQIANDNRDIKQTYLIPFVSISCILSVVGAIIGGAPIHVILLRPILWLIIFSLSIPIVLWISRFSLQKIYNVEIPNDLNEKIIGYSLTGVFFIRMVLALFPNFFIVRIFAIFSAYILKSAMDKLLPIDSFSLKDERKYYMYLIINSVSIVMTPFIMEIILDDVILPNINF